MGGGSRVRDTLRPTDEDPGGEDQASAYDDLKTGESEAGLEVAVTDEGDNDQFNPDDCVGPGEGGVNVGDEEGQRVKKAADEGHKAGDQTAEDGIAATSEFAVVGEPFGEGHGDAGADGRGCSDEEDSARVVRGEGSREDGRKGGDR